MAKRKYPSELNSRTVRVNIGDWQWLNSLSQRLGITVAQAFHKVITELDRDQDHKAPVQRTQIPLPVTTVRSVPAIATQPMPAIRVAPVTTIATNGSKAAAFRIKPKGVKHE